MCPHMCKHDNTAPSKKREAIALRLEAIASRLEAIASRFVKVFFLKVFIQTSSGLGARQQVSPAA